MGLFVIEEQAAVQLPGWTRADLPSWLFCVKWFIYLFCLKPAIKRARTAAALILLNVSMQHPLWAPFFPSPKLTIKRYFPRWLFTQLNTDGWVKKKSQYSAIIIVVFLLICLTGSPANLASNILLHAACIHNCDSLILASTWMFIPHTNNLLILRGWKVYSGTRFSKIPFRNSSANIFMWMQGWNDVKLFSCPQSLSHIIHHSHLFHSLL